MWWSDYECEECEKIFGSEEALMQHERDTGHCYYECDECDKVFSTDDALHQHQRDTGHLEECFCGETFRLEEDLNNHIEKHQAAAKFVPCFTCAKPFSTVAALKKHQVDTYHYKGLYTGEWNTVEALFAYLDAYYKEDVMVSREDRRKSRKLVQEIIIKDIMSSVRQQNGGYLYANKLRTAGSTSTQTKVGKADEFDFNIPLNVTVHNTRTYGRINYKFQANFHGCSLEVHRPMVRLPRATNDIPDGYASVKSTNNASHAIHSCLFYQDIVPRYVQQDLYNKIETAINRRNLNHKVNLQDCPHGPALTLIIRKEDHAHEISVDIAVAIDDVNVSVSHYGWPRRETKACLSQKQISTVINAGVILVPKHGLFWKISFSRSAKVLLNLIDSFNECRRKCHQILKRDFKLWQSKASHGFKGISTYMFKHHLFWMNERFSGQSDYWINENIGRCYTDMLKHLAESLHKRSLSNYFNVNENILESKQPHILNDLAWYALERRNQLMHIQFINEYNQKF